MNNLPRKKRWLGGSLSPHNAIALIGVLTARTPASETLFCGVCWKNKSQACMDLGSRQLEANYRIS